MRACARSCINGRGEIANSHSSDPSLTSGRLRRQRSCRLSRHELASMTVINQTNNKFTMIANDQSTLGNQLMQRNGFSYQVTEISSGPVPPRYSFLDIHQGVDESSIIEAAKYNWMGELNKAIDERDDLNKLVDAENRSLLHYMALHNNSYIFNRLLMKYKVYAAEWLQQRDNYRCQAAHYIAYQGNLSLLETIEKYYSPKDLMGFAAYGDRYELLLSLYAKCPDKGISEDEFFADKVTPLHMACYGGGYYCAILLMKWGSDVNAFDIYNQSPLFLAAKKNHYKLIRKLFHRGAKSIPNIKELTLEPSTLDALNSFRYTCKSVFCQLNIKPRKKSWLQAGIFLCFYVTINGANIFNLYEFESSNSSLERWPLYIYYGLILLNLLVYLFLVVSVPGYVEQQSQARYILYYTSIEELIQRYQIFELCLDCSLYIQPRAKHCEFCRKCVAVYDHHCPWVNNCIGRDNIKLFGAFIILLFLVFLGIVALNIYVIVSQFQSLIKPNTFAALAILIIASVFEIPLFLLISVQTMNCMRNQTTYERLILEKPRNLKRRSIIEKMDKNQKKCFE